MVVDMHCHYGRFPGFIRGENPLEELVERWDRAGVDVGILAMLDSHDMSAANELTRQACERYPGRIYGYVYLNPHDIDAALAELERRAQLDIFRGVKLHPANDVFFPFYEGYYPLYERIEQLGLPILWHSGTYPNSHPLQIAYVARQFPGVPFILAHFALADISWECFPAAALADNVHVDTSGNPIIPVMDEWVDRFGPERMLWGSDFPFYHVEYEWLKLDYLGCSEAAKRLIAGENARRLFRL